MTTIRVTPAWDRTWQSFAHESAKRRGAPTCSAKGLSDLRGVLSVKIAAVGSLVAMAFRMSSFERGEPMIVVIGRPTHLYISFIMKLRDNLSCDWSVRS